MNVSPSKFWRYFAWWNITKYMTILELVFASQNKHTPTKNRVLRSGGSTMSLCQNYCCLQKNDWCQNIWIYCSWSSMCMSQCCRHSIVSEAEPFGANFGLRFCAFKNSLVDEVCFSRFFSRLFSLFFYSKWTVRAVQRCVWKSSQMVHLDTEVPTPFVYWSLLGQREMTSVFLFSQAPTIKISSSQTLQQSFQSV